MASTIREEGWSCSLGCLLADSSEGVSWSEEGRAMVGVVCSVCGGLPCL